MNNQEKDVKDNDLEFWRLTLFKLTFGTGEISKAKESKPVQNKLRNTENLHETWTPNPNVESACHQFVIHLCWMPHDVACSFSLCRCYGNSEKKSKWVAMLKTACGIACGFWNNYNKFPEKQARRSYRIVQGKDQKLFNNEWMSMYFVLMHLGPLRAV